MLPLSKFSHTLSKIATRTCFYGLRDSFPLVVSRVVSSFVSHFASSFVSSFRVAHDFYRNTFFTQNISSPILLRKFYTVQKSTLHNSQQVMHSTETTTVMRFDLATSCIHGEAFTSELNPDTVAMPFMRYLN